MEFKEKYKYGGWNNCIYISNSIIDFVATTDIGPRIIRLGCKGERNLLLEIENEMGKTGGKEYRLYGGARIWHSPEENPRSYMPDNEKVKYKWKYDTLTLTQDVEKDTGMQKEISLGITSDNGISVVYKIYNRNIWPIQFAPWALTLMARNGRAIIPQEPYRSWEDDLLPARPLVLWSYTKMNDHRWIWGEKLIQLKQDPDSKGPQKVGLLNKLGWIAYYLDGFVFIKRYAYNKDETYPDYNCNTEVYSDPNLFELESLGALETIDPQKYIEHKENWYVYKVELGEDENEIIDTLMPLIDKTSIPSK